MTKKYIYMDWRMPTYGPYLHVFCMRREQNTVLRS